MSSRPCGCDPDLKGGPYYCERHVPAYRDAFVVKDSGQRTQFESGSLRDTAENKVDYETVFNGPLVDRLAAHLTKGALKYPDDPDGTPNWMRISTQEELVRYRKSAIRHFRQWLRHEADEDHFAATVFNMNGCEYLKGKGIKG